MAIEATIEKLQALKKYANTISNRDNKKSKLGE
jgi:hypothetical protein